MKRLIKALTASVLFAAFLMLLPAYTQEPLSARTSKGISTEVGCGERSNGLQLCISKVKWELTIEFRNLSPKPVELKGFKLIGTGEQHPGVKLLAEIGGKHHVLRDCFQLYGYSPVDPWIVQIPSSSSHSITIDLLEYCGPERSPIDSPHWLTVEYTGTSVQAASGYWSGTVKSARWWVEDRDFFSSFKWPK